MPFARKTSIFPHSIEWFYIPLRDIMTDYTTFDWSKLDAQLNAIAGRGHHAIFRVYVDYPKRATGIPQFLLDAGLATYSYSESNNLLSETPSVSPDYRDQRLIKAFANFISALGARYDGDSRIGFITAGLYGFWGEWHVLDHPKAGEPVGWTMLQSDKDLLLNTYKQAFKRTQILLRYPNITTDAQLKTAFGYHDDSFAYRTLGPVSWEFWPQMISAALTDQWKKFAIGGEIRPEIQSTVWDTWPNTVGQDVTTAIQTTHVSWLSSGTFDTPLTGTRYDNALRAHKMLGYELNVPAAAWVPQSDGKLHVTVKMENRGVAPFYYNWPVVLQFANASGALIGAPLSTDWKLSTVLPGTTQTFQTVLPAVPANAKELLLRVSTPLANGNPLRFANAAQDRTVNTWLSLTE